MRSNRLELWIEAKIKLRFQLAFPKQYHPSIDQISKECLVSRFSEPDKKLTKILSLQAQVNQKPVCKESHIIGELHQTALSREGLND